MQPKIPIHKHKSLLTTSSKFGWVCVRVDAVEPGWLDIESGWHTGVFDWLLQRWRLARVTRTTHNNENNEKKQNSQSQIRRSDVRRTANCERSADTDTNRTNTLFSHYGAEKCFISNDVRPSYFMIIILILYYSSFVASTNYNIIYYYCFVFLSTLNFYSVSLILRFPEKPHMFFSRAYILLARQVTASESSHDRRWFGQFSRW